MLTFFFGYACVDQRDDPGAARSNLRSQPSKVFGGFVFGFGCFVSLFHVAHPLTQIWLHTHTKTTKPALRVRMLCVCMYVRISVLYVCASLSVCVGVVLCSIVRRQGLSDCVPTFFVSFTRRQLANNKLASSKLSLMQMTSAINGVAFIVRSVQSVCLLSVRYHRVQRSCQQ